MIDKKYELEMMLEEFAPELNFWDDEDVAFIKNDICDGKEVWAVYSADGIRIAAADSRDMAVVLAKQNEMMPKLVN